MTNLYFESEYYEDCKYLIEVLSEFIDIDEKNPKKISMKSGTDNKIVMDRIKEVFEKYWEKMKAAGYHIISESPKVYNVQLRINVSVQNYLEYYNKLLDVIARIKQTDLDTEGFATIAEISHGINAVHSLCFTCCLNVFESCRNMIEVYDKIPEDRRRSPGN